MRDLNQTLKELSNEDIIWIVSVFTAIFAIISNQLEREYISDKIPRKKRRYKTINITIAAIAFFIYLYFFLLNGSRLRQGYSSRKESQIQQANFIAASFVLIASVIYLLTEILSDDDTGINLI